jgi:putative endonuclease
MNGSYHVYIAANEGNTVLYTGVTNDLARRMGEHKAGVVSGFSKRNNVHKLLFHEGFPTPAEAIVAEKKIKGFLRRKKLSLIASVNPEFSDLSRFL